MAGLLTSTAAWAASPAEQGELLATKGATGVLACATCHGAQGQGMAAFPYLAGQGEAYLARQLGEFASGTRNNPVMGPIAKAMSAEQITAASAYYAQLPPAFNRQTLGLHMDTYPTKGDDGAWLALETYMFWLAKGAPTGAKLEGQSVGNNMVFPALWGDNSYNWGAGMHGVPMAAAFIKANMPLGQGGTLTDQQAWDVAYYMNSHERPQDPRYNGNLEETRTKFHNGADDLYGQKINGVVLGEKSTPSGGRLRQKND